MPRAHWAQRLCGAINDHTAQRTRRWCVLRSEIKEEAAGRGTFAEQGTPSACARPDNAAYKVFVSVRMKRALFGE